MGNAAGNIPDHPYRGFWANTTRSDLVQRRNQLDLCRKWNLAKQPTDNRYKQMYPVIAGGTSEVNTFRMAFRRWLCDRALSDKLTFEREIQFAEYPGVKWLIYTFSQEYTREHFMHNCELGYHGTHPHVLASILHLGSCMASTDERYGHGLAQGLIGIYFAPTLPHAAGSYSPSIQWFDDTYHKVVIEYVVNKDRLAGPVIRRPGGRNQWVVPPDDTAHKLRALYIGVNCAPQQNDWRMRWPSELECLPPSATYFPPVYPPLEDLLLDSRNEKLWCPSSYDMAEDTLRLARRVIAPATVNLWSELGGGGQTQAHYPEGPLLPESDEVPLGTILEESVESVEPMSIEFSLGVDLTVAGAANETSMMDPSSSSSMAGEPMSIQLPSATPGAVSTADALSAEATQPAVPKSGAPLDAPEPMAEPSTGPVDPQQLAALANVSAQDYIAEGRRMLTEQNLWSQYEVEDMLQLLSTLPSTTNPDPNVQPALSSLRLQQERDPPRTYFRNISDDIHKMYQMRDLAVHMIRVSNRIYVSTD